MKCDAKAFAKMYETVYRDLYRFALCTMKNSHDAEDAVSEAVMNAYEHIASLRSEESFRSWIFTILVNVCRKRLKKQARQTVKEDAAFFEREEETEPGKSPEYELSMDLKKAFSVLSEEERAVIGLSVFSGYRSEEIGRMLGLKDSTVRSKRKRALRKMEILLKDS
ncbi:sigma-70 family RNA polymerase sigma factor [Dorea acetigenes]|jgi:RNA polymerase sigma factor (sigma-70 family)|uniref:Sigma-70 family RNA polymerase sigma factor n=1 Tax=Dorea acetigenes TaxID=2981787 RepID=A0ABT2RRN8_9FIRM|nr:sigma-70 family RNA polymerase sigma factor [Dorea acetigenes]MCB6415556.1 sigma-70 family RNA polymerase sigma factor [Faecalimonas umbilicata]MCU6688033.1 sigma-70 family RNA polymerase sigma factor [Dorea acetigenes]SCJ63878.1 RNA polymerase sigma factor sigV [uncultured Clostridium sp.]